MKNAATYTLEFNFGVGCCYGSFAILKDGVELATIPFMWPTRRSCLAALKFVAYLEQIPEPECAKLKDQLNAAFDEYERATRPMVAVGRDFFTETIINDILRTAAAQQLN